MNWSFVNDLFNSVLQYVLTGAVALGCILLGIKVRKSKNAKESTK